MKSMNKWPFNFSLWVVACVSIGFGLAYLDGVSSKAIISTATIIAGGVTILILGAWILKTSRK